LGRASKGNAAGGALRADATLDALRWNWGDAYDIGCDDGVWWFRRRDGIGSQETASSPDALRRAIVDDYTFRPMRRETTSDALDRRDRYEAAGVRIWHDAGGWHARWPVKGTHTGISHPSDLGNLLDKLDALAADPGKPR
jgi:hypothetical protein